MYSVLCVTGATVAHNSDNMISVYTESDSRSKQLEMLRFLFLPNFLLSTLFLFVSRCHSGYSPNFFLISIIFFRKLKLSSGIFKILFLVSNVNIRHFNKIRHICPTCKILFQKTPIGNCYKCFIILC